MATLEKIRNKSVLLFVIIILALLAFILGDFLTSGRTYFGSPTTVAKVGGVSVDYQEYQNRMNQVGEQMRNQGRNYSNDVMSQNVVQGLIADQLLKKEYQKLGITVTDSELTEALTGSNPDPQAYQMIAYLSQQLQLPEASGRAVFDAMQNPAKYGLRPETGNELRQIWANQEKDTEANMLNRKFMNLVSGLYTYNKLDAKSLYDDYATTRHIKYVTKDISSIGDDQIEFTDADIKAKWNEVKGIYELPEEMREINYIYVPIEPSQSDRIAAQQAVENAVVALNETPGTEGVASDTRFVVTNVNLPKSAIRDARLRTFLDEHTTGQAALLGQDNDSYAIAKINGISLGIDSINVTVVRAADGVDLDSIAALINSGKTAADLASNNVQGQDSIWTALEGVGLDENTKNALANATVGKAFVYTDTIQGNPVSAVYKVNRRHAPVSYYDLATIEYTVDPSQETLTDLTTSLRTFISNNSSAQDFTANAEEAGYAILSDQVGPSSTGIGNASESRRFVKWAVENKKGKVSPLLQDDKQTYLMAIAVMDIYDDYLPYTSPAVKNQLASQSRNEKKAAKLLSEYQGKADSLAGYASAMGVEEEEGDVTLMSPSLLNVGFGESTLQGAIAAAEPGKLVGPVQGTRGILVFEVTGDNTDNRPFTEEEYGQRFARMFGLARQSSPLPLLLGSDKIDNRSLNFVQSVGE